MNEAKEEIPKQMPPDVADWENMFAAIYQTKRHIEALHQVIMWHEGQHGYFSGTSFFTQAVYHREVANANKELLDKAKDHLQDLRRFFDKKP